MSKGARKISGFLWAMVLAVVSFFIIYLFFPDFSNKYLGVSLKNPKKVGEAIENAGDTVKDAASSAVSSAVDKVIDGATSVVMDKVVGGVESAVGDILNK